MPSTPNGNGSTTSRRFELPQLILVNYSLTEGTNIPPPLPSPVREVPPPPPPTQKSPSPTTQQPQSNGQQHSTSNGATEPRGRTQTSSTISPTSPASPTNTSTTRPGSIRRFLSRRSLNSNYNSSNKSTDDLSNYNTSTNSHSTIVESGNGIQRPGTSLEKSYPRAKRSSSWFRRLGSSSYENGNGGTGGGNRTSVVYEVEEKKGPPAPRLPELRMGRGGKDEGLGGEDMFKNIR